MLDIINLGSFSSANFRNDKRKKAENEQNADNIANIIRNKAEPFQTKPVSDEEAFYLDKAIEKNQVKIIDRQENDLYKLIKLEYGNKIYHQFTNDNGHFYIHANSNDNMVAIDA